MSIPSTEPDDAIVATPSPPATDAELDAAGKKPAPPQGDLPLSARVALYGAITLALAVLAAFGIQGDVLGRLIRNQAEWFPIAVAVVLLGGVLPFIGGTLSAAGHKLFALMATLLGAICLLAGVGWMFYLGAGSLAMRDQPVANLHVEMNADGTVHIIADGKTSSLKADEKMLLDVKTIDADAAGTPMGWCRAYLPNTRAPEGLARSLYWGETGPSATGSATDALDVVVDRDKIRYVCVRVALHVPLNLGANGEVETNPKAAAKLEKERNRSARDAVVIIDTRSMHVPEK